MENNILFYGLDIIRAVQQYRSPAGDALFQTITLLGQEMFYLLALPLILWCVDFAAGMRLAFAVLLSHYLNFCIKDLIQEPRPFVFQPEIKLVHANGPSLPSNHAQGATVFWLGLARLMQRRWLWFTGAGITGLIGFSRIYLGVHFPTDVLAGWGVGVIFLIILGWIEPMAITRLSKLEPWQQAALALFVPVLLFGFHADKNSASVMAALSGAGFGLITAWQYIADGSRTVPGEWTKLLGRAVVGITGLLVVWSGLKAGFPPESSEYFLLFHYIRYWLTGIWLTLGAPWVFVLVGLVPGITRKTVAKNTLDKTQ